MKTATLLSGVLALMTSATASASGGSGDGVPISVWVQSANLGVLIVLIVFFGRKPIAAFFAKRLTDYRAAAGRADRIRQEAEAKSAEIKAKLHELESGAKKSIETAKADSAALGQRLKQEMLATTARMKTDAQQAIVVETDRVRLNLADELADKATVEARSRLTRDMGGNERSKLNREFIERLLVNR